MAQLKNPVPFIYFFLWCTPSPPAVIARLRSMVPLHRADGMPHQVPGPRPRRGAEDRKGAVFMGRGGPALDLLEGIWVPNRLIPCRYILYVCIYGWKVKKGIQETVRVFHRCCRRREHVRCVSVDRICSTADSPEHTPDSCFVHAC